MLSEEKKYDMTTRKMGIRRDQNLYQYIIACWKKSKKYLEEMKVFERAEKYAKMYDGDIWDVIGGAGNRPSWLSKVNVNLAFDVIETGLAVATSRPPAPNVDPAIGVENEEYQMIIQQLQTAQDDLEARAGNNALDEFKERLDEYGQAMQRELVKIWKTTEMHSKNQKLFRECGKVGIACLKSVYDSAKKEIKNEECDLASLFPSPNVDSIPAHAEKREPFIYAVVMSVDQVRKKYGVEAIDEAAIGEHDDHKVFKHKTAGYRERIYAAVKSALEFTKKEKDGTHVIVLECYVPDDETKIDVDIPEFDDDGVVIRDENGNEKTRKEPRKKFASGFKVVTVIVNHHDWIIAEHENLYENGRPPFFPMVNYPQLGSFYGISEIKNIADLIMRVNNSLSNIDQNLKYTGNPALLKGAATKALDDGPITNRPGQILDSPTGTDRYLEPPRLGNDVKWFIEFLIRFIDRLSRLSEAIRGVNEFSTDSGRKIRELRQAAAGLFQPKLDEQVRFSKELFKHWAYIYQNLFEGSILQKVEDINGTANFEEFIPRAGQHIKLNIDVSTDSILPKDIWSEWEEGLQLYNMTLADGVTRLISAEHLISLAPTLEDKQRAINYVSEQQELQNQMAQRDQAFQQFVELAAQASEISEQMPGGQEEDEVAGQLIQLCEQFPEFLKTNEYAALPRRLRLAILAAIAKAGMQDDVQGQENGNTNSVAAQIAQ